MENLILKSEKKIRNVPIKFIRDTIHEIDWNDRLIGIKGARGVGKTTLVLQYIRKELFGKAKVLYVGLDDLYFADNRLYDLATDFASYGGTYLFLDEVHRYPDWSKEIKLIYDDIPELKVVFTGSSLLSIVNTKADLSRRSVFYQMQGLSFREYLAFNYGFNFKKIPLESVLSDHKEIAFEINSQFKVLPSFKNYLNKGYFPFFKENPANYLSRLSEIANMVLEVDIPAQRNIKREAIPKLKKLLYIISNSVPFKPNIQKLSEIAGITRNTIVTYINYLEEAAILNLLHTDAIGIGYLRKPEKIYLENTNLNFALSDSKPETGNLRESFFLNQLKKNHKLTYTKTGDFMVNEKYTFEIGGKNKTLKQIAGLGNAYLAQDDIEAGIENKVPLWLFGFLY
ncbi:MAG: AAA family ATPase [Bacteroidales bacterium]|nr:AAA family ATPase [Bacteroidales bacterium]MCF8388270.1 AAA family ATPase [Bacteroidales bacterium]MCF8399132.1 AAA family ATPase [Bacteroidales bacterium]